MRALNVLLAVAVSLAIGVAVFEFGLRLHPSFAPTKTMNRFDARLGWSKEPGKEVVRKVAGETIHFAINPAGLRDDADTGPGKAAGTFRVLMLGDSFVLGYTVERRDLFVDRLEDWWNEEGRRVDVVNTGTEGWSTDQEVAWFLEHGPVYAPDLVLLFPYENDVYWNGQTSYATGAQKPRFEPDGALETRALAAPRPAPFLQKTAIVKFLGLVRSGLREALGMEGGVPAHHFLPDGFDRPLYGEWAVLLNDPPAFLEDAVARTRGALIALKRRTSELGARLVVVPLPSKSAIDPEEREYFRTWEPQGLRGLPDDRWNPDRPVNLFIALASELDIDYLDPRSSLVASDGEKLYFEKDTEWHFNAEGNERLAAFLHDELDRREVFPADHRAVHKVPGPSSPGHAKPFPKWPLVFAALWIVLGGAYVLTYPKEKKLPGILGVGALLALIFTIVLGGAQLVRAIPSAWGPWIVLGFVALILGFVIYKLGRRVGTILELLRSFTLRGHWYLMPLVVVLLSVGSLLVVAASSPLIAPFIYTLF